MFSGYENFVSRIDPRGQWPEWMTKVDFAGLKQKLLASIVAISAIQVLKAFMNIDSTFEPQKLGWLAAVHMVVVLSTLLIAWLDRMADHGQLKKGEKGGHLPSRHKAQACLRNRASFPSQRLLEPLSKVEPPFRLNDFGVALGLSSS